MDPRPPIAHLGFRTFCAPTPRTTFRPPQATVRLSRWVTKPTEPPITAYGNGRKPMRLRRDFADQDEVQIPNL